MIETSRGLNDSYIEQNRGPINEASDGEVMFLNDLRKITNLSAMRKGYNTIIHCQEAAFW